MLDRAHRLTHGRDFAAAIRHGRRAGSTTVVVHLDLGESTPDQRGPEHQARVGLVVAKKVGNAVVRNRVKRRLRHLVHDRLPLLPDGARVVVRALPTAGVATSQALGADLDKTLERTLRRGDRS